MFFSLNCIAPMALGIILLLFSTRIADVILSISPDRRFSARKYRNVLYVWPIRFMGLILIIFGFWISKSGPPRGIMNKDENQIALLENGEITKGEVTKSYYQRLAPEGWEIVYKFNIEDPKTGEEKTYWGSAQGPRKYYKNLSAGDPITVLYYPPRPKINCEIRYFLNKPSYRDAFKDAGKLALLDRFKNEYRIEDYSFKEWYELQWEK